MPDLRIALAQTDPVLGDLDENVEAALRVVRRAADAGADLVVFGELALSGTAVGDLATRPGFLTACRERMDAFAARLLETGLGGLPVVVGFPDGPVAIHPDEPEAASPIAQSCAGVLHDGGVAARHAKARLTARPELDERSVFLAGEELIVLRTGGVDVALAVGDDARSDDERVTAAAAGVLLVIAADEEEDDADLDALRARAADRDLVIARAALTGRIGGGAGGGSVVIGRDGVVVARAPRTGEQLVLADVPVRGAAPLSVVDGVARVLLPRRDPVS